MATTLACTTKLCLVLPQGPSRETEHSLVVQTRAAATYTDSENALFNCFDLLITWVARHGIQAAGTMVEVQALAYESLKVELEVTAVR